MTSVTRAVTVIEPQDGHVSSAQMNTEAILAWHRAHGGGVTVVLAEPGAAATAAPAWSGVAMVDDGLTGDTRPPLPDTQSLERLRRLGGTRFRAIRFPGLTSPTVALLDRDGTMIEDRPYLADPDGVRLLPGAAKGLRDLAAAGLRLVVVTNQSGVAAGLISPEALREVHQRLISLLQQEGITLSGIYTCPHAADAGCPCRKPATGLALQAAEELGFDLERAIMVGDKPADLGLARRLGVPAFLVTTGDGRATLARNEETADYLVDGLDAVARICSDPAGLATATVLPPD